MEDLKLKPCPFCGGKAYYKYIIPINKVVCKNCGATPYVFSDEYEVMDSKYRAIEAWNRRADDDTK